jgi:hypothetical protein
MCAPAAIGVASAATGILGAVGGQADANSQYNAQVAGIDASNAYATQRYNHQIQIKRNQWQRETQTYNFAKQTYESQRQWNQAGANRAYNSVNRKLSDTFKRAAFQDQEGFTKLLQMQGTLSATDQSGNTADMLQQDVVAAFGRGQAQQSEELSDAVYAAGHEMTDTWYDNYNRDITAWSKVAIPPSYGMDPLPPQMQARPAAPSSFGMIAGIGSSLVGGAGQIWG